MEVTRRKFFQNAGTLAAAAAAGIPLYKGIREYGPVDIRLYFFSMDPHVIKGDLLADQDQDLFRVRAYHEKKVVVAADLKLSEIQKIVAMPRKKIHLDITLAGNGHVKTDEIAGISRNGTLAFLFEDKPGEDGSPIWLMLEDVKKVL